MGIVGYHNSYNDWLRILFGKNYSIFFINFSCNRFWSWINNYCYTLTYFSLSYSQILQKDRESSTSEFCDILQLSSITLLESPMVNETQIKLHNTEKMLCQRCRRHPELDKNGLCGRCIKVLDITNVSSVSM